MKQTVRLMSVAEVQASDKAHWLEAGIDDLFELLNGLFQHDAALATRAKYTLQDNGYSRVHQLLTDKRWTEHRGPNKLSGFGTGCRDVTKSALQQAGLFIPMPDNSPSKPWRMWTGTQLYDEMRELYVRIKSERDYAKKRNLERIHTTLKFFESMYIGHIHIGASDIRITVEYMMARYPDGAPDD